MTTIVCDCRCNPASLGPWPERRERFRRFTPAGISILVTLKLIGDLGLSPGAYYYELVSFLC